jgi:V/A-type H+-transporting ATPase subunit C
MIENGYAFAAASVRAKEVELLSQSFMSQLLDSDYTVCVELLADKGIIPHDSDDPIADLSEYMNDTWNFICAVAPDITKLNFMIVKNDFHNLKAVFKSMVTNSVHTDYFLEPCIFDPNEMYAAIKDKKFDLLPGWLQAAAEHGYEIITSTMDGQLLDVYLDTKSLEAMQNFAENSGCDYAKKLTDLQIALTDIKVALRLARGNASQTLINEAFCECDKFDVQQLKREVAKSRDDVISFIGTTEFSVLTDSLEKSKAEFEKACDNLIIGELNDAKFFSFSEEPMIAYYYARENECKMLRIILSCKHIGLGKGKITERMRELYV